MKITCQSCQAKYTIADEKVAGKTVKIKCKKCGATIVVSGSDAAAATAAPAYGGAPVTAAPPGDDDEGDGATRVFSEGAGGSPGGDDWTVNVTDDDQRTLTGPQIVMEFQRGVIKTDTYVWKDGMADWAPISDVPELMRLVSVGSPRPAAGGGPRPAAGMPAAGPAPVITHAPQPAVDPIAALSGTMIMNEPAPSPYAAISPSAAAAAASPAAARRSGKMPAVDLFASGQHDRSPAAPMAMNNADRQLGERNENSVLFSISALTAAAGASKGGGDDPFDLAGPPRNGGRGNVDDIMNLGGGMSAGPMLAPPPLLAPVVEAPPPPPQPVMSAPSMSAAPAMSAVPAMRMDQLTPPPKSKAPLIIGAVAVVALLGGVGAFFATRGPAAPAGDSTAVAANTGAPTAAATTAAPLGAAPTPPPQADTAKPADTAAVAVSPTPTATPVGAGGPAATPGGGGPGKAVAVGGPGPGKGPDPKVDKTPDPPTPPPTPPPAATAAATAAPAGGGGKDFDRAAAMAALSGASGAARGCKKDDGPTGTARVKVTFAPSGSVTSASVDGPPFSGTAVGGCIAGAFRGAHVPAFDGSPVTVTKSISIN